MKRFKEFATELKEENKMCECGEKLASECDCDEGDAEEVLEGMQPKTKLRDWVINQLENTERDHGEIVKDFVKLYGKDKLPMFDKIVSEIVD